MGIKDILPEYPSTRHLPWKPNSKGDKIITEKEASVIFDRDIVVQEKIDGANCGMAYIDNHPVVRSRTKILRKGQSLKNASVKQFGSAWNWMHSNKHKFEKLAEFGDYSIYGEWMIQAHGCYYRYLPDWFIAYDVYDFSNGIYLNPLVASEILEKCGFSVIPTLLFGKIDSYDVLEKLANENSVFSKQPREGIVVKIFDNNKTINKFKMVRQGFEQGCLLETENMNRNSLCQEA